MSKSVNRDALFAEIASQRNGYDLIVIGGGATGAGIAWDAASRGLSTLLLERGDFGEGTSSKSTKLIHGGVRYLAQGQLGLVREGLQERRLLLENAPAYVRPLRFVVPLEGWIERIKYHAGLRLYDLLARSQEPARYLSAAFQGGTSNLQPRFSGAMTYVDAQFDDTRLLLAVLSQAVRHRALVVNYAEVISFSKRRDGHVAGVVFRDRETGREYEVAARIIINATGPAVAATARLDHPDSAPQITLSRGSHVVVEREFWPSDAALLMPRTPDNRVMFAIPWHGHVLLGTTDAMVEPMTTASLAAVSPSAGEIDFILDVAARYLQRAPQLRDVRACFAGVRPLAGGTCAATARVSREYQLTASTAGLITITGGKWTTFRRMAAACVDYALQREGLRAASSTTSRETLPASINLWPETLGQVAPEPARDGEIPIVTGLGYCWRDAVCAIRVEMARHVDDILARRTRALFLNAAGAYAAAPAVAQLLARELGHDERWIEKELDAFEQVAAGYRLPHHPALST